MMPPGVAAPAEAPRITIPVADLGLGAVVVVFVTAWCWAAGGSISPAVPVVTAAAVLAYYGVGALATTWPRAFEGLEPSFPLRFLAGYAVVNAVLFAVLWVAAGAFRYAFVGVLALAAMALVRARPCFDRGFGAGRLPAMLATVLALVAATLWAQDCLPPTQVRGAVTVFRPWVDSFFHAAQIASVAGVHDVERLQDAQFAFLPARFYHYATYITPALVKAFTPTTAYAAYAGMFVPMGTFMTALGAYVLVGSWWGSWPAFAGAAAVLLLPDAPAHGTHNAFMAYHWMQLVGANGMYAVAILALAWALLLRGCAAASRTQIAVAWALGALTVVFKAQFFLANALLLWIVPPLMFRAVAPIRRAAWLGGALLVYGVALWAANQLPGFPTMRFDGSAVGPFVGGLMLGSTGPGVFRDFFAPHLLAGAPQAELVAYAIPYVLSCAVGLFGVAYVALAAMLRRSADARVLVFPGLVLLNFLVMAVGLALDERGIGSKEELLHRPFVWAYFVTAAWVGGAGAVVLLRSGATSVRRPLALAVASVALLAYPAVRGAAGGQAKEGWSLANVAIPTAYTAVAEYVREHAAPDDLVQDLRGDPRMVLTALTERRPFLVKYWIPTAFGREHAAARAAILEMLVTATDAAALAAIAQESAIRWVIVHPGDVLGWPAAVLEHPAFEAGGYRVYRL
jgi:hypothetical protein